MNTADALPNNEPKVIATTPSTRRAIRETALRVLYAIDAGKRTMDEVIDEAADAAEIDERGRVFLQTLVAGTLKNREEIDLLLDRLATGFPTDRQAVVDRNILRLAAAELMYHISDAPHGAIVNEAVELAKKYSTKESGRFVNGVLGGLVREIENGGTVENATLEIPAEDETNV